MTMWIICVALDGWHSFSECLESSETSAYTELSSNFICINIAQIAPWIGKRDIAPFSVSEMQNTTNSLNCYSLQHWYSLQQLGRETDYLCINK